MKLFFYFFFSIILFFIGFSFEFSSSLMASRPATKTVYDSKNTTSNAVFLDKRIETKTISVSDSIQTKVQTLPEKPKKSGLGMIIGGSFLSFLGIIFGVVLLLTFLLGFSIFTIGSGFYFKDIYAIAGVMLGGLIIFGLGVYMISRGRERWKAYKKYKKAIREMQKA